MKVIKLIPRINKRNKQINFSLPKKQLPKDIRDKIGNIKSLKIKIKDLNFLKRGKR